MSDHYFITLCDVYSHTKRNEIFCKAGERVKQVVIHGDVILVENKKGNRFPVHSKKLTIEKPVSEKPQKEKI